MCGCNKKDCWHSLFASVVDNTEYEISVHFSISIEEARTLQNDLYKVAAKLHDLRTLKRLNEKMVETKKALERVNGSRERLESEVVSLQQKINTIKES